MSFQPPFAEANLQEEEQKTDQQTDGIPAIRRQIERKREIDNGSGNGLGDVVRQTHLTIKAQVGSQLLELFRLV